MTATNRNFINFAQKNSQTYGSKNRKLKAKINQTVINNAIAYTNTALQHYNIISVWLFGSYVRGTATEDSDIDIALVFDKLEDKFQAQLELMKLRRNIDFRIEPHPIDKNEFTIQNHFVDEIINTGLQIYSV